MPNLNSEKYERYVKALFVGPTGRGKTIAAASWPGKTLIIDLDGRHKPVIEWFPERVKAGDFVVEEFNATNFWSGFVPLVKGLGTYNPYDNIILDGITSLSNTTIIMLILAKGGFGNWLGKTLDGSKITSSGIMVPSWDEYAGESQCISTLLESLRSFKCNLFITAHPVARTLIEKNKKTSEYTSITTHGKKIESIVPTYFDEVWFFDYKIESDNSGNEILKRTCFIGPSEKYFEAKTALKLPKEIDYTDRNLYDLVKDYL